jgi:histone H3/H4
MPHNITLNDKAIIEEALKTMRSKGPTIPEAHVKKLLAKIGEEIDRTGGISKEVIDRLLQQLHAGVI